MLDRYQGPRMNVLTPATVVKQHAGQSNIPYHNRKPDEQGLATYSMFNLKSKFSFILYTSLFTRG